MWKNAPKKRENKEVTTIATAATTAYATTAIIVKAHIRGIKIHNHLPVVQFMEKREILFLKSFLFTTILVLIPSIFIFFSPNNTDR